jgi:hypothetical protein
MLVLFNFKFLNISFNKSNNILFDILIFMITFFMTQQ